MPAENRRHLRVPSYAKALLLDGNVPGYIRDLSLAGCQVAFLQPVPVEVGALIRVQVIAVHDPSIAPFRLPLRVRRRIEDPPWHSLGTEVEGLLTAEETRAYESLVEYYGGG